MNIYLYYILRNFGKVINFIKVCLLYYIIIILFYYFIYLLGL